MTTFKFHIKYKDFFIFKNNDTLSNQFFGFKFTEDKKSYKFRTKNYKTLKSVKKEIDLYLKNK